MMKKNNTKIQLPEFTNFHLIIFGIFIVSLAIRIYGAYLINLTSPEAEILLSLSKIKVSGSPTFFYGLVIRILRFFGGNSDLGVRIVNGILGALITTFPALFYREIGKRTAIIASLLLSFDPFGIANSIVFSGNIATLFFLGLIINAILHGRSNLIHIVILLFIGHGRGLGFFLSLILILLIILYFTKRNYFSNSVRIIKENISQNINDTKSSPTIILVLILALIFKIPLSNIASDLTSYISGWGENYLTGNYPIVYPFAIISSIPLALVATLIFFLKGTGEGNKFKGISILWLALTFIVITFYPKHLIIDLIWISIPLCIFTAIIIEEFISQNIHLMKDDWPFIAVLFSTGINFGLNLIAYVYRSIWGLDLTNTLLAILLIGIFAIILLLYKAYTSSLIKAFSSMVLVLLVFSGISQLSISARAMGLNKKPENEILWNGYYEGKSIVSEIIATTKTSLIGTSGKLNVYIDELVRPVEIWTVNSENVYFRKSDLLSIRPDALLTNIQTINFNKDTYQGQEFISNSYPIWTWDPVSSYFSTDYWNWFFFRNNLQYKEYNFIWTNKSLLNNKITNGAN